MTRLFDASAVLALLRDEPGAAEVERLLAEDGGMVTPVNVIEVLRRLRRDGHPADVCEAALDALPIFVAPFTREMSLHASRLDEVASRRQLSLGDRACLGAAIELDVPVVTADRAWSELELPIDVVDVR